MAWERSYYNHHSPSHYSDPLIEVYSVTISPLKVEAYEAFSIYGEIYVVSSEGQRIDIYDRPESHPEIIVPSPSPSPSGALVLTGPDTCAIKMDVQNTIYINLKVQGLTARRHGHGHRRFSKWDIKPQRQRDNVWSAKGSLCLDEPDEPGYHQHKSLTLNCHLLDVEVSYTYMPFARIAQVCVCLDHGSNDIYATSSTPDGYISGNITAHYNSVIGGNSPSPIILFDEDHAQVHYWADIDLCRSFLCIPSYSSLSLKSDKLLFNKPTEKHQIDLSEDINFSLSGHYPPYRHISKHAVRVAVGVRWFTTDVLEISLEKQNNLKGASTSSIAKSVLPQPIVGSYRIQVLSLFVGHGGKEQVDIRGKVAIMCGRKRYIFKKGEGCPGSGKAPTLEGLTSYLRVTSYPGDDFGMNVELKDVGSGHVDINNSFRIYEYHYTTLPGKWLDRPLCHVLLGKQGFAAVHFILFESAVKATVKISVIFKGSNPSCSSGSVNGTLVAQYSNYDYSTNYRRKYWSLDLFRERDARSLPTDGKISLLSNVVSVPEGSSLILDADLYVSSGAAGTCDDHFVKKVKIRIGDVESRIKGQTYDVVVRTKWESGWE